MDEFKRDLDHATKAAQDYVKAEIDLIRIELTEKLSDILATVVTRFVLYIALILPVIFAFLALGYYLSALLESKALGFLSVTGIMIVILLLLFVLRKPLIKGPIQDSLIKGLSETLLDDDD